AQKEGIGKAVFARDLATADVVTLKPNHNLNEALDKFLDLDVEQMPVVSVGDPKKVIGLLLRSDVKAVYNREILVSEMKQ
ncbi:MAG: CBS domain-containing protein, partial [Nitrospinota bacterium]|nr:CBS domain-containing protein [Nitrospinota bacterium]